MSQVKVVNNSKEVKEAFEKQAIKALTECGLLAEGFAIQRLTEQDAVKTGLLRNSITFGITGEPVNKKSYKADVGDKKGHYDSDIPKERNMALYVGTNVEYASYIEHGTGGRSDAGMLL